MCIFIFYLYVYVYVYFIYFKYCNNINSAHLNVLPNGTSLETASIVQPQKCDFIQILG